MSELVFRLLREQDLPRLGELVASLDDEAVPSPAALASCFARIQAQAGTSIWLAWQELEAVGTYQISIIDTFGHGGSRLAVVESVAVEPEKRGAGIGAAMMQHARQQAAAAACYKLMLSSNRKRIRAHDFYRRLGFAEHGISFAITP